MYNQYIYTFIQDPTSIQVQKVHKVWKVQKVQKDKMTKQKSRKAEKQKSGNVEMQKYRTV